jgi:transposase
MKTRSFARRSICSSEKSLGRAVKSSIPRSSICFYCKRRTRREKRQPPPRWRRLTRNAPVIEEVIDPEEVKEAPEQWRCIGSEVSEQLDYEPARFLKRRLVRRKYVSRQNPEEAPVIAGLPPRLQERSIPAAGLLAQIIVSK